MFDMFLSNIPDSNVIRIVILLLQSLLTLLADQSLTPVAAVQYYHAKSSIFHCAGSRMLFTLGPLFSFLQFAILEK